MKLKNVTFLTVMLVIIGLTGIAARADGPATPAATAAATQKAIAFVKLADPKDPGNKKLDLTEINKIDLKALPIIPKMDDHVLAIWQEGQRQGNNPQVFTKDGDCMTATPHFLIPFASGATAYALDKYTSLQKVIDFYSSVTIRSTDTDHYTSFSNPSVSAASGFNTPSVLDSTWSDPKLCTGDESPLACEYRLAKPATALIMFGTNDVKSISEAQFDYYLRQIVVDTANAGILPILSTFPTEPTLVEKSQLYNKIIAKIAKDYDVPLINLWLALEPLPNRGVDPVNTTHMTQPTGDDSISFTPDNLKYGFNMRNLVTLQTLEALLQAVNPDALK